MRNVLVHGYFDIDLDILWATITEDFPKLLEVLPQEPRAAGRPRLIARR
jgi:uncharacterized protein with HEPN domain